MGELIKKFTLGRNALKRTIQASAEAADRAITDVERGVNLTQLKDDNNGAYNVVRDLISFMGVIARQNDAGQVTRLGEAYRRLYRQNEEDAWRWLVTRSLWRYVVPNGTAAAVNGTADGLGASFAFFRLIVGALVHLHALPGDERFLYYEELCAILDDDAAWQTGPLDLFVSIQKRRAAQGGFTPSTRSLLDDLEDEYEIPRDNLNTVLNKAFQQTGLFEYKRYNNKITGLSISPRLDVVLQGRLRFVLDHPVAFDGAQGDWQGFLDLQTVDLPEEVSLLPTETVEEEAPPETSVADLVPAAMEAFGEAGFQVDEALLRRFAAALLAKPFVILTGLTGSGKTGLGHAFARWICPPAAERRMQFVEGRAIEADGITYTVTAADALSVEVASPDGTRVALPLALIEEWVAAIREGRFGRAESPRTIREAVGQTTYSTQLNSFESQLKALAFSLIEADTVPAAHYEVVPVEADWTGKENLLGYADALDRENYVCTAVLDLIRRADLDRNHPYFLILDEMNLSHVERYFAAFLSAIETGNEIILHGNTAAGGHPKPVGGVPPSVPLPPNLFILGTVNVDETTYQFSPKVLDRANSLEFRIDAGMMGKFLEDPRGAAFDILKGRGKHFGEAFAAAASRRDISLPADVSAKLKEELALLFDVLAHTESEFGFRTAKEIAAFVFHHRELADDAWSFKDAMDAQVYQKILPKLNGSRRKLEPILCALAVVCARERSWNTDDPMRPVLANAEAIREEAKRAAGLQDRRVHLHHSPAAFPDDAAPFRESLGKIRRMLRRVLEEGFASFAEA